MIAGQVTAADEDLFPCVSMCDNAKVAFRFGGEFGAPEFPPSNGYAGLWLKFNAGHPSYIAAVVCEALMRGEEIAVGNYSATCRSVIAKGVATITLLHGQDIPDKARTCRNPHG